MNRQEFLGVTAVVAILAAPPILSAWSDEGHSHGDSKAAAGMMERMKQMHGAHEHEHHFEAMERLSEEEREGVLQAMIDLGLALPPMDSEAGRDLFLDKGCIVCHRVNGVGGEIGPAFAAKDMPEPMNAFEFAARMWRGAPAMVEMQQDLFGEAIELSGQELADIIAFVHDEDEQHKLAADDVPERYRELIAN